MGGGSHGSKVVVVGVRCRVMVVVAGIVQLWSWWLVTWLLKKRCDVTHCDITVMFKLTHENTCIKSHDFIVDSTKNAPVLVQSWLR